MKIRAICYFITARSLEDVAEQAKRAIPFFKDVLQRLADLGVPVQMVRFATNSFEEYLPADADRDTVLRAAQYLEGVCKQTTVALEKVACIMSIGDVDKHVEAVGDILRTTELLFINMPLGLEKSDTDGTAPLTAGTGEGGAQAMSVPPSVPDFLQASRYAKAVLDVSETGGDGLIAEGPLEGMPICFKCTMTSCLPPGTPFFPGAIAPSLDPVAAGAVPWKAPAFAIATENSDLVAKAFTEVPTGSSLSVARESLRKVMREALQDLDAMGRSLEAAYAEDVGIAYVGIDPSIATAAAPEHSVVSTWANLLRRSASMPHGFGGAGTLTLSAAVTAALKSLGRDGIRICGYAGLMLPQTEDDGLASAATRGELSLYTLLLNSAVCGTGIDTGLIPGETECAELALLFCDVATLAHRLSKPLSCRVWPVKGKKAGDLVEFRCPFFVKSSVLPIRPHAGKTA